jgi:hypothetical protein
MHVAAGRRYSRVTRISTPDQSYDDELDKRNEDASNDAERQRDEEARRGMNPSPKGGGSNVDLNPTLHALTFR